MQEKDLRGGYISSVSVLCPLLLFGVLWDAIPSVMTYRVVPVYTVRIALLWTRQRTKQGGQWPRKAPDHGRTRDRPTSDDV